MVNEFKDLKNGIALCELVGVVKGIKLKYDISEYCPNLKNVQLALNELRSCPGLSIPREIFDLNAEAVCSSDDCLFKLLSFLKASIEKRGELHEEAGPEVIRSSLTLPEYDTLEQVEINYSSQNPTSSHKEIPTDINMPTVNSKYEEKQTDKMLNKELQEQLLLWLEEIRLIKPGLVNIEKLPSYCRNGVLLADLINRLEGVTLTVNL